MEVEESIQNSTTFLMHSNRDKILSIFNKLVSIVHSEISIDEAVFLASEIWRRCNV
jgi:hypothetical protein